MRPTLPRPPSEDSNPPGFALVTRYEVCLVAAVLLSGRLAARHHRALPPLVPATPVDRGRVSIVIPARNEEQRLPMLLASLRRLDYPTYDILVIDDGSVDRTAPTAREHGCRVLTPGALPPGWTGKSFACHSGANATDGEWLLFTDADTEHGTNSLTAALALAAERNAGMVSLLARQICASFWERLLLPYAYFLYFVGAAGINRSPGRSVANGQYLLCRRDEYDRAGGHAAVRDSLTEDVSLAHRAAAHGTRVLLARGEAQLNVHMYDGLRSLWEGFGKNAFRFVRLSPRSGMVTGVAGVALLSSAAGAVRATTPVARIACLAAPAVALTPWYRMFGIQPFYGCLYPVAASVFQLLTLDSIRKALLPGATVWKGRRY